ncbi:hypothetical protein TraAM80_05032 [Trypanosoma rangeli]|uniref:Carbohydrate-binding/sugar hydrolysis domain-containing protein n=1 Tax=Trypanosoma rangeli TaxID=5698 RepID=A0A3R7LWU4_TRYRA|nr:uncharacterized protein TraAM80_05032 [Trypanosoma rangeli]RNF04894.1 hypothetical protein TraAM80_05032 [Trypanosoma rangeli]|eukprot:RNF04894.1 hypothetical protein TraAM80_05032 [Trypanosoma rangeli]
MLVNDYVVEERMSVWQKKKVRTYIVNGHSKVSSRRSIAGALTVVKPYERIELVGGEYFESLSISMPLEIVAAEGEEPCIISRGPCLTVTQDVEVYFEHVEFVSKNKTKLESAVALTNGKAVFFRCKMNSIIINGFARPVLDNCTIAESYNGYGVQIGGSGGAQIYGCTIHAHYAAGVEIDTKGTVVIRDSTIRQPLNGGHGVIVQTTQSAVDDRTPIENLACRKVTVTKCRIYLSPEKFRPKERDWGGNEKIVGPPSCVVIARGACPVFTYNEIIEGYVGFTFEFSGDAVLEGNSICNQKHCGILVIVDERSYSSNIKQNVRITGGNVIDRCLIGVDIRCMGKVRTPVSDAPDTLLSQELPCSRNVFDWIEKVHQLEESNSSTLHIAGEETPVFVNGRTMELARLKEDLRTLAKLVCAGHPSHFYGGGSTDMRAGNTGGNPVQELVQEAFQLPLSLPPPNSIDYVARWLQIRGNKGVDILDTRFSGCGLCAIRFGHGGYGLVEDCDFLNCGATAIVVSGGAHPLIVGCKFNNSKGTGVFVENFANPLIMGNEISQSAEHGIEFCNLSRGIVMGNIIFGNSESGILVTGGSTTMIVGNLIQQGHTSGAMIAGESKPLLMMNKFVSNPVAQLLVCEYSMPFIAGNTFASGPGCGIRFESCSGGMVVGNTLSRNERGIVVELDSDPYLVSNKILQSHRHGVVVGNNGLGTFVANEIAQSGSCNFIVQEGGSPVVRNNTITGGHVGGIAVIAEGGGIMEHNVISENAVGNVILLDRFSEPVIVRNTITNSTSGCGVICGRGASGAFLHNKVYKNKQCGVYVISKADPLFLNNVISYESVGVVISECGRGTFKANNIHASYGSGIIIQLQGNPVIKGNNVSGSFLSGIVVSPESSGTVTENNFFENDVGVQLGSTLGTATLDIEIGFLTTASATPSSPSLSPLNNRGPLKYQRSTSVRKGGEPGDGSDKLSPTMIRQNKIYANTMCGVLLEAAAYGALEENEIESNGNCGVVADVGYTARRVQKKMDKHLMRDGRNLSHVGVGGGSANLCRNRIFRHKHANIAIVDHAENNIVIALNDVFEAPIGIYVANGATIQSIDGNTIHRVFDGVYAERGGCGCFENNRIYDCDGVGVYVCSRANPEFTKGDVIEDCRISGVFVDAGGRGVFTSATIRRCIVGAVVYTCPPISSTVRQGDFLQSEFVTSAPLFRQCTIEEHDLHGVLVLTVATSYYPLRNPSYGVTGHTPKLYGLMKTPGVSVFPQFHQNTIRNNRHFGVCHEMFNSSEMQDEAQIPLSQKFTTKARRLATNIHFPHRLYRRVGIERRSRFAPRESLHEALGTSAVLSTHEHHEERMQRQVSFVENTITNCSIGVVVGGSCHPFLLRNRISQNAFFGMFLRFRAKAMCFGCEVTDNGMAGLYVAQGSFGTFTGGKISRNNGFCRPDGNPHDPRSFASLPFTQSGHSSALSPPVASDENPRDAFKSVLDCMESYANMVAEGLHLLCELVSASSVGLSLASGICPSVPIGSGMSFGAGLHVDGYDRGWAADGGIGVWMVQGNMMEIKDNVIEGNRNVGIFYSRDLQQHHLNLVQFVVESVDGFPRIPGGEVISGAMRSPREAAARWAFFTSTAMDSAQGSLSTTANHSFTESWRAHTPPQGPDLQRQMEASSYEGDRPYILTRPAMVSGNSIARNGSGVVMHLHHVMMASALSGTDAAGEKATEAAGEVGKKSPSTNRKSARRPKKKAAANALSFKERRSFLGPKAKNKVEEASKSPQSEVVARPTPPQTPTNVLKGTFDVSINMEANQVYENYGVGIICLHVVEVMCGHYVKSRLDLEEAAAEYNDVCIKVTLKRELMRPKLQFALLAQKNMTRYARLSSNEVYRNVSEQLQVTSRYVVISQNCIRTLLNIDTLREPSASLCSSQALLRIPLFASLMSAAPPCGLLIENNSFRDSEKGLHVVGFVGGDSLLMRHNTFVNIAGAAILLHGHLASANIGDGNVFEANRVGIRITMPDNGVTAEDIAWMRAMGVQTHIHANRFCAPKNASVIVEGGGAPSPVFKDNQFSNHMKGSVAFFIASPSSRARLVKNVFFSNYIPVIITNKAGTSGEGGDSVVVEGNRFTGNFVGLLVADGAAPRLVNNLFEKHYRTGLEIVGEATKPMVQHCIFVSNKQSEVDTLNTELLQFPEQGQIRVEPILDIVATIVPDNKACSVTGKRLSSGVLISGGGDGGTIHECLFKDNDIGVDVVGNVALAEATALPVSGIQLTSCLFNENNVAGVWVRGEEAKTDRRAAVTTFNLSSSGSDEGTVIDSCFFINNTNDAVGKGDVVAVDAGYAVLRGNLFSGSVHGMRDGAALFERNTFYMEAADVAVYLHKAARIRLIGNILRGHKNGIVTSPAAWGHVEKNLILNPTRGVYAAPFCHTFLVRNRIIKAKDCGILAYGGIFTDNEVCWSPMGVIVQNPMGYKDYSSIPNSEKTAFDALISENRVHSCEGDGILVAGGARIEGNCVFNCKYNLNVICPPNSRSGAGIAIISKNSLYDGEVGLVMAKDSESVIRDNDIFDNSLLGVWIKAHALGTLQGNAISSSLRDGAFDVEPGAEVKVLQNNIRNQFSPSYHKTLPLHREKERQRAAEALTGELTELDGAFRELRLRCNSVEVTLRAIFDASREGKHNLDGCGALSSMTLAGHPARALRGLSETDNAVEPSGLTKTREVWRFPMNRTMPISAIRASRSANRRMSQSTLSAPKEEYRHVLIYVCNTQTETLASMELGKAVEAVFTSVSLSSNVMFRASLETKPSGFHASITAQMPDIIVVTVAAGKKVFDAAELGVFSTIERLYSAGNTKKHGKNGVSCVFTLLPSEWRAGIEREGTVGKGNIPLTGLEYFAAAHNPMYFNLAVAETFSELVRCLETETSSPLVPCPSISISKFQDASVAVRSSHGSRSSFFSTPQLHPVSLLPRKLSRARSVMSAAPKLHGDG